MNKYFELLKNYNLLFLINNFFKEIYRLTWINLIRGSYAQNYEDLIISKLINKKTGTYLEIGGYHPTRLSNTYFFYKKGWRGTVVEPNPEVKELFKAIRPEDKFINAGIADKNGQMDYYQFLIPAINTFSKTDADESVKKGHKLLAIKKIKLMSIKEIVYTKIDLLSLDTEGFDEIILKNWPWEKVKPQIICVETDVRNILEKHGYELAKETVANLIFALKN